MNLEIKLLTETQAKRMYAINDRISRGIMPGESELRDTRSVLACGCPEALLRSVVAKNATLVQERRNRRAQARRRRQVHPRQAEIDRLMAKAVEYRKEADRLAV